MNTKQAFYIRTIAREGSITAAAKALYISQPSLSQTLRQIEQEVGMPLFDRDTLPLRPTYAGEKYLECAGVVLAASERLENQLQEIRQQDSGRLRLGISVQRAMQILPQAMPWFAMQFPKVHIELTEAGSAHLEQLVSQGQVDLALAALESTSTQLRYTMIERETIGILAGRSSALAQRWLDGTPLTVTELAGESVVSLRQGHSVRVVQDALFRRHGLSPAILLETDSLEVAKRVALGTGACMLCSDIYVDQSVHRSGSFYPLKDYDNHRHFYACRRKDEPLPRYVDGFVEIVSRILEDKRHRG